MRSYTLHNLKETLETYVAQYKDYLIQTGKSEAQIAELVEQKRSTLRMFVDYLESEGADD